MSDFDTNNLSQEDAGTDSYRNRVTIVETSVPAAVNKTYTVDENGKVIKRAAGNILQGVAQSISAATADELAELLMKISRVKNQVLIAGEWINDNGEPFGYVSEKQLAEMLGLELGAEKLAGVIEVAGRRLGARLRRGIKPSVWVLLDADNPPGIPEEWAGLSIGERLALLEDLVPGISRVERIELRASSARVRSDKEPQKAATHAWIRVSNADLIPLLKTYLAIQSVNKGLSFPFKKKSRSDREVIVGIEHRTVVDLSVLDTGRIVFIAEPTVDVTGYVIDHAEVTIINRGGGVLDIDWLRVPGDGDLREYKQNTGISLNIDIGQNFGLSVRAEGQLRMNTEIESRGRVKPLSEWAATMRPGDKLRCEAPFRESSSEAAFIRMGSDGRPFVHDVGNGTTYTLAKNEQPRNQSAPGKYLLEQLDEISFDPNGEIWLIDNLLPSEGLAVVYGKPKSLKSFAVAHIGLSVARGVPWAGREVRQGPVVYICGEGAQGFRKRINGYRRYHQFDASNVPFYLAAARPNLGVATADLDELITAINAQLGGQKPVLLVLDTLARMLSDKPENGEGMINFANNAEAIAERFGCLVIAVHHTGKNEEAGMRGHSSLPGAMVAGWRVTKTGPLTASIKIEDAKDGEDGFSFDLTLKPIELGINPKTFEAITTLVVTDVRPGLELVDASDRKNKRRLLPALRTFMREVSNTLLECGVKIRPFSDGPIVIAVTFDQLKERYYLARSDLKSEDSKRKAFARQLQAAIERELLITLELNGETYIWSPE